MIIGVNKLNKRLDNLINLKVRFRTQPLIKEQEAIFNSQGASIGKKWQKRKGRANNALLDKTGKLKRSLKATTKDNEVRITRNVPYFKYHQLGTRHIPARPSIGISDRFKREAERQVKKEINSK